MAKEHRIPLRRIEDKGTYATDLFKREALRFINAHKGR